MTVDILDAALHSPIFAGGAALGAVGGSIAAMRRLPSQMWGTFLRTFTVTAEIPDSDYSFEWLQTWIDKQPAARRIRNLTVNTGLALRGTSDDTPEDRKRQILLTPAVGNHILRFNRQFMWLSRERKEGGSNSDDNKKRAEYWHIRLFGRNQNIIRDLIADARETYRVVHKRPHIMVGARGYWESLGPVPERNLASVVLPEGVAEDLVADAEQFLKSREWYVSRGVPYRRGYMFEGPPGTGKSSLVTALAHHLKKPVYVLNLGGMGISDDTLVSLLCSVPSGAIILFEDIDATTRSRTSLPKRAESDDDDSHEATEKSFVSLSGLLNALDGLVAKEGRIAVMTTNHPDRLDPALVRPGRVDKVFTLGHATVWQAQNMFLRFFDDAEHARAFGAAVGDRQVSPAAIQEHLLRFRNDAVSALANGREL